MLFHNGHSQLCLLSERSLRDYRELCFLVFTKHTLPLLCVISPNQNLNSSYCMWVWRRMVQDRCISRGLVTEPKSSFEAFLRHTAFKKLHFNSLKQMKQQTPDAIFLHSPPRSITHAQGNRDNDHIVSLLSREIPWYVPVVWAAFLLIHAHKISRWFMQSNTDTPSCNFSTHLIACVW